MQYLWVDWIHDDSDTPVVLVYELGEERLIGRFIERFRNGEMVFEKGENTEGWYVPVPELDEIEALGEFRARYIGREEFELLWALRNASE